MTHLSDEQFEDVLADSTPEPDHLVQCERCRNELAERRAMRSRLRSAFAAVHVSAELVSNIQVSTRQTVLKKTSITPPAAARVFRFARWAMPLSAAALIFIGISVFLLFTGPDSAIAAPAELFRIHQHSLSPHTELYSDADPESLAGFLKEKLGFRPAVPRLGTGMSLRGCCIVHFRDKPVGSYVVDTPRGVISVIIVTESPESLGMKDALRRGNHTYMAGSFARCEMVTVELGGYTYCAVGEVTREYLVELLEQLVW